MPPDLAASTVRAALLVAAGAGPAGVTSEPVAHLTRGIVPAPPRTLKVLAVGVAGIGLTLGGFGLFNRFDTESIAATPAPNPPVFAPAQVVADGKSVPKAREWRHAHTLKLNARPTTVAFGPDFLAAGGEGGELILYHAKTGREKETLDLATGGSKPVDRVQVSPDGKQLFVVTNERDEFHLCSVEKAGRVFQSVSEKGNAKVHGVTADGAYRLLVGGDHKELGLVPERLGRNQPPGRAEARFVHDSAVEFAAGATAAAVATVTSGRGFPVLRLWSKGKDEPVWEVKLWDIETIDVTGVAVAPGGTRVAVAGDAGAVWIFDGKTGKRIATGDELTGPVSDVVFSPDGKRLAVACSNKTARVIDAETGKELAVLKGHAAGVTCVAFGPGGNTIATGSYDKTVRVWEFNE